MVIAATYGTKKVLVQAVTIQLSLSN